MKEYFKKFINANRGNLPFIIFLIIIFIFLFAGKIINLLVYNPLKIVQFFLIILSITLHEVGHAYAAHFSGDNTAKYLGRLSFNPIKHIDPMGFLLPILLIITNAQFIIGWAKPVPVNYSNFKNGRLGEFFVSIAGVLVNFILAFLGVLLIKFFNSTLISLGIIQLVISFISFNTIIGIFNLIPIPPLDGSKLIASFAPESLRESIFSLERYGFFIIIFLMWSGVLGKIISPIYRLIMNFFQLFL